MTKRKQHGGRRKGAGRKLTDGQGTVRVSITLTPAQQQQVERWMDTTGADSFSEAVREMLDAAMTGGPGLPT